MSQQQIQRIIERHVAKDGMVETSIKGVHLFRLTEPLHCAPAVYQPNVSAIVSGAKEVLLDGKRYVPDRRRYLCCALSMPLEAGAPTASPSNPLMGVYLSLDTRVMTELAIDVERTAGALRTPRNGPLPQGFALARWDQTFEDALLRLLQLLEHPADAAVLGDGRLREVYYAVLKGEAGGAARRAYGVGNEIARTIEYVSGRLDEPVTIDDMAAQAGMSRAVFHRKFKQATTKSPLQFVKAMRLNTAAIKIAGGMNVSEAAMDVGYTSPSQFSREFKRLYGQSPRQWSHAQHVPAGLA